MMADLLPGRLDAAVMSLVLARPYLLDKRLKGLAVDAAERWSVIPDVPTLGELGLRDAAVAGWYGVAATPGTPRAIRTSNGGSRRTASRLSPALRKRWGGSWSRKWRISLSSCTRSAWSSNRSRDLRDWLALSLRTGGARRKLGAALSILAVLEYPLDLARGENEISSLLPI